MAKKYVVKMYKKPEKKSYLFAWKVAKYEISLFMFQATNCVENMDRLFQSIRYLKYIVEVITLIMEQQCMYQPNQ